MVDSQIAKERNKLWRQNHSEELKIKKRDYYLTNKDTILTKGKHRKENWDEEHKLRERQYHKEYAIRYHIKNLEKIRKHNTEYRLLHKLENAVRSKEYSIKIRTLVLTHYGNGKCVCGRCGFADIRALSIDHINGNGNQMRKVDGNGVDFYNQLKKRGFPEGYQTLCMNCQFIKRDLNKECKTKWI